MKSPKPILAGAKDKATTAGFFWVDTPHGRVESYREPSSDIGQTCTGPASGEPAVGNQLRRDTGSETGTRILNPAAHVIRTREAPPGSWGIKHHRRSNPDRIDPYSERETTTAIAFVELG